MPFELILIMWLWTKNHIRSYAYWLVLVYETFLFNIYLNINICLCSTYSHPVLSRSYWPWIWEKCLLETHLDAPTPTSLLTSRKSVLTATQKKQGWSGSSDQSLLPSCFPSALFFYSSSRSKFILKDSNTNGLVLLKYLLKPDPQNIFQ